MLNSWSKITTDNVESILVDSVQNEEVVIINQIYCNKSNEDSILELCIKDKNNILLANILHMEVKPNETIILGSENKIILVNESKIFVKSSKSNMNIYLSGDSSPIEIVQSNTNTD